MRNTPSDTDLIRDAPIDTDRLKAIHKFNELCDKVAEEAAARGLTEEIFEEILRSD